MVYFNNDYSEGCHQRILDRLQQTNLEQNPGYGMDPHCARAAQLIKADCGGADVEIHFLVGGTQANLTVIAAALRPYQAVIGAESAHINVHETGAVEGTGHKVLTAASADGKISARQVEELVAPYQTSGEPEHMVQPKMVYISNPTELGTLYTLQELEELSRVCRERGLLLFLDGARLGYGLTAEGNDVTMADLARLCDVFYIGGTKMGALFGEAVVFSNHALCADFRYMIKRQGGMLAKGRLLGIQFETLFEDGLYYQLGARANRMADEIRAVLQQLQIPLLAESRSNQIFAILPAEAVEELGKHVVYTFQQNMEDGRQAIRFCTSWATTEENVRFLCDELRRIMAK